MSIISLFDMRRIRLIIVLDIAGSGRPIGIETDVPFFVCLRTRDAARDDSAAECGICLVVGMHSVDCEGKLDQ